MVEVHGRNISSKYIVDDISSKYIVNNISSTIYRQQYIVKIYGPNTRSTYIVGNISPTYIVDKISSKYIVDNISLTIYRRQYIVNIYPQHISSTYIVEISADYNRLFPTNALNFADIFCSMWLGSHYEELFFGIWLKF
jgi:hypothetical protein